MTFGPISGHFSRQNKNGHDFGPMIQDYKSVNGGFNPSQRKDYVISVGSRKYFEGRGDGIFFF